MLVEPGPLLLPELGEKQGAYAQEKLAERKDGSRGNHGTWRPVERRHNDPRAHAGVDSGNFAEASSREPATAMLSRKERGCICVDEFMRVPGYPGVWAMGDCAAVSTPNAFAGTFRTSS